MLIQEIGSTVCASGLDPPFAGRGTGGRAGVSKSVAMREPSPPASSMELCLCQIF